MASITTSTASSASFLAILARPARKSRAVRDFAGSEPRAAITASYSRATESTMRAPYPIRAPNRLTGVKSPVESGISLTQTSWPGYLFSFAPQRDVAANSGGVHRHHLFNCEAMRLVGATDHLARSQIALRRRLGPCRRIRRTS